MNRIREPCDARENRRSHEQLGLELSKKDQRFFGTCKNKIIIIFYILFGVVVLSIINHHTEAPILYMQHAASAPHHRYFNQ